MIDWNNPKPRFVAELAGSAAVLLGLVFVGLELRQNTAAVQATTSQGVRELSIDWLSNIATSPELAETWAKALSDPAQLEGGEEVQVSYMLRAYWLRLQTTYYQWRRGALSDGDWAPFEATICRRPSATTGGQLVRLRHATWADHKESMTDEFAAFVERCWAGDARD